MILVRLMTALICTSLTAMNLVQVGEWRGLIPLRSTKNDVIRLLGPSQEENELRSRYHLQDEDAYIVFANEARCGVGPDRIQPGTILMIEVTPNKKPKIKDLQLNERRFRKFDPSSPPKIGYEAYINDDEGIIIRSYKGIVDKQFYLAAAKDRGLCPGYYDNPDRFAAIFLDYLPRKFDEYSEITFEDEKARLDNFAIYLQKDEPKFKGYLIVYAGRRTRSGEAQARGKRAKNYLVKVRGIDARRIVTIDGGYREYVETELYAVPPNMSAPTPNPTVAPSEVRIITKGKAKNSRRVPRR